MMGVIQRSLVAAIIMLHVAAVDALGGLGRENHEKILFRPKLPTLTHRGPSVSPHASI